MGTRRWYLRECFRVYGLYLQGASLWSAAHHTLFAANVRLVVIDSIAAPAWATGADSSSVHPNSREGHGYTASAAQERTEQLAQQAGALKQLADTFAVPVLVTNQVGVSYITLRFSSTPINSMRRVCVQVIMRGRRARVAEPTPDTPADSSSPANAVPYERGEMSALTIDGELAPALGPTWAHCVSSRLLLMPRAVPGPVGAAVQGAVTIVKSPCAPQLTLPYTISAKGWGKG